jgi:hypothetical protein
MAHRIAGRVEETKSKLSFQEWPPKSQYRIVALAQVRKLNY